jgi:hypothetical protein
MADHFRRMIRTLRRLQIVKTLPSFGPQPVRRPRYRPTVAADQPRTQLPVLEHALRRPGEVRWLGHCDACGVWWVGHVRDVTQPAAVLATLAVMRVPCPVCWARAWASADQATREAWSLVPSWLTPRWR